MKSGPGLAIRAYALGWIARRLGVDAPGASGDAWIPWHDAEAKLAGPGSAAGEHASREMGAALVDAWAQAMSPLAQSLPGDPVRAITLVTTRILPEVLRPASIACATLEGDRARGSWSTDLPKPFVQGILEATLALSHARAHVRVGSDGSFEATWRVRAPPGTPTWTRLVQAARLPFLVATLLPVLVASAVAAQDGPFQLLWAVLTLVGVAAFHAGSNALNDYYDHQTGADTGDTEPAPFVGGQRLLEQGLLSPTQLKVLSYGFYAVGTTVGLVLVALRGIEVLWLGLAGFLLGVLYTAPPVRLAHRGLGELAVAVGFGPLIVMGTYYVQRQTWSLEALLASLPLAFLIAAVLYLNEFPDRQGDARVGKRTLIVRLPERSAVVLYVALVGLTYVVMLAGVALAAVPKYAAYAFPTWSLLGLLTLPLSARAALILARNYRYPYRLIQSNASTILVHLATAALFAAGYLVPVVA